LNESTGAVTINGGIVFAYGTEEADIIKGDYTIPTLNKTILAAWDKEAGTTDYESGTSEHIFKEPKAATAVWAKQSGKGGIAVNYNATSGFIPIAGITIDGEGIASTTLSNQITVYPNPTSGELRIVTGNRHSVLDTESPANKDGIAGQARNDVMNIEVFDVFGRQFVSNLKSQTSNLLMDISHLPAGVYFVRITTENGVVTRKIIKSEL
jgi:hypothetical protein